MKTKPLLRKLRTLLSKKKRKQLAKYESLEKILRKLRKRRSALQEKLTLEDDDGRRRELERKLEVLDAQLEKGMGLMDALGQLRRAE